MAGAAVPGMPPTWDGAKLQRVSSRHGEEYDALLEKGVPSRWLRRAWVAGTESSSEEFRSEPLRRLLIHLHAVYKWNILAVTVRLSPHELEFLNPPW